MIAATGETKPTPPRRPTPRSSPKRLSQASPTANDKVVAITAAMPNGTALDLFRPHHPTRYFDVGIAEEHAVIFAAGMATKGYKPFCRHLLHLPPARLRPDRPRRLPPEPPGRLLHGSRRPLRRRRSHPPRPLRHQLPSRQSPTSSTWFPKDEDELAGHDVHRHAPPRPLRHPLPAWHRPRNPAQSPNLVALEIGKAEVIRGDASAGEDVAIFGIGAMLPEALRLAALLEREGLSAAVINPRFAKPIDRHAVRRVRATPVAPVSSSPSKTTSSPAASAPLSSKPSNNLELTTSPSSASAGPTSSSSTAKSRLSARNTVSPQKPPSLNPAPTSPPSNPAASPSAEGLPGQERTRPGAHPARSAPGLSLHGSGRFPAISPRRPTPEVSSPGRRGNQPKLLI